MAKNRLRPDRWVYLRQMRPRDQDFLPLGCVTAGLLSMTGYLWSFILDDGRLIAVGTYFLVVFLGLLIELTLARGDDSPSQPSRDP